MYFGLLVVWRRVLVDSFGLFGFSVSLGLFCFNGIVHVRLFLGCLRVANS